MSHFLFLSPLFMFSPYFTFQATPDSIYRETKILTQAHSKLRTVLFETEACHDEKAGSHGQRWEWWQWAEHWCWKRNFQTLNQNIQRWECFCLGFERQKSHWKILFCNSTSIQQASFKTSYHLLWKVLSGIYSEDTDIKKGSCEKTQNPQRSY